ncbi:hypothetical protein CKJ55_04690 [Mycobacterium avium]|uniref:Uncharacterized protein n=1 Tax=Mycobacterium avium TaxID=1764 RepID=A0A2A2ZNE2_MYCAV|nr:hypothetical protein [Mycobacterium avium]ETZ44691.1 hypothetical protein L838_3133 [Mycobacterium avium MAV_120709_2344]MCA4735829.1 hypothetical protein [Mycobacterium avium subsp. hominissuis]MCA4740478.1 hypothetical protein [Mycobacterium avium subsp. hominissuis]MCA4744690.1 hypothetical protein [Mycobacterium avium subsp. hominissuis]MCA4764299.1 hypothetical protein [Mycobacterium avium subsp. hominissuis]
MTITSTYDVAKHDGDQANGVADIVSTLLGQNLTNFPKRIRIARSISRPVSVYSTDTDTACTAVFGTDNATVYNDINGRPSVTVRATVDQILAVSQLKMKVGGLLPVGFFTKRGLGVLGDIVTGKLVVKGLFIHPVTALRFIALVSIVES